MVSDLGLEVVDALLERTTLVVAEAVAKVHQRLT
jgi:hypothetical protein